MACLSFKYLFLFVFYAIPTSCQGVPFFIFGDSLFDAGNNNYINTTTDFQANFWPYGETFFKYPTGRFSDGRLIPDFIAECANLPFIPPYLKPCNHEYINGINFASGGAGALVETNQGFVIDLREQLSYFKNVEKVLRKKQGDEKAKKRLAEAVYLFSIGNNDYLTFSVQQSYSEMQYVNMVVGNLTSVIKELYKLGGRKFAMPDLGPIDCIPSRRRSNRGKCADELSELAKLHKRVLSKALKKLESQLMGFKYSYFSLYNILSDMINNPSNYGFKEGESACCGSGPYGGVNSCGGKRTVKGYQLCSHPSNYLFFDSAHPTERANQQLAEIMWKGSSNFTSPYNLEQLFKHT